MNSYQYNEKHKENVANEECRTYDWMRTFDFRKVEISQDYPQQRKDRILEVAVAFNLQIDHTLCHLVYFLHLINL